MPYLAWQVYQNNLQAEFDPTLPKINIAGTMVGNGATDWDFDSTPTFPQTVAGFSIIPQRLNDAWLDNGCHEYFRNVFPKEGPKICQTTMNEIETLTGGLNWYDLYRKNDPNSLLQGSKSRYATQLVAASSRATSAASLEASIRSSCGLSRRHAANLSLSSAMLSPTT